MITVNILINGQPIYTRSAVNKSSPDVTELVNNTYAVDTGVYIKHKPVEGAVALAKKMLDTIKESKGE
jgi:hypothetical protein